MNRDPRRDAEHRAHVVLRRPEAVVLAGEERHVKMDPPLGRPAAAPASRERLVEIGGSGGARRRAARSPDAGRSSRRTVAGGPRGPRLGPVAGNVTFSAELSCTRPIWMPACRSARSAAIGVLVLDREVAAVEAHADVIAQLALPPRQARSQARPPAAARRPGSSRRSKNSMGSSVVSIRQSGSGSMSRWMNVPVRCRSLHHALRHADDVA